MAPGPGTWALASFPHRVPEAHLRAQGLEEIPPHNVWPLLLLVRRSSPCSRTEDGKGPRVQPWNVEGRWGHTLGRGVLRALSPQEVQQ